MTPFVEQDLRKEIITGSQYFVVNLARQLKFDPMAFDTHAILISGHRKNSHIGLNFIVIGEEMSVFGHNKNQFAFYNIIRPEFSPKCAGKISIEFGESGETIKRKIGGYSSTLEAQQVLSRENSDKYLDELVKILSPYFVKAQARK